MDLNFNIEEFFYNFLLYSWFGQLARLMIVSAVAFLRRHQTKKSLEAEEHLKKIFSADLLGIGQLFQVEDFRLDGFPAGLLHLEKDLVLLLLPVPTRQDLIHLRRYF
jgi:hypothetical protein